MKFDADVERVEILKRYGALLRVVKPKTNKEEKKVIRKAFNLALEAHKDMRRRSGEPYIYHPLEVAHIATSEIGLGTTSIVCALLHDVVEDTDYTLADIEAMFGDKVAKIIDGLTKMSGVFDQKSSLQAENFRKMLLTLSDDVRVILIKLADRLHNMRTLDAMPKEKQLKIASETLYLFAPLAHRLGLYAIKSELEDLSMKYIEPDLYDTLTQKLQDTEKERNRYIRIFSEPIEKTISEQNIQHEMYGRVKSIQSIWRKMKNKEVTFEEVYDLFAIRIIIDSGIEQEKTDCWRVYSLVTDYYRPNPDRLRDWISTPKSNGYEALHTTVMGPEGKWVEVQIRSRRMDDIAEKGYAAHWKYKESASGETALDEWLRRIRELLKSQESNALDFLDEFKLNLFSEEIFVFTPKGDLRSLPIGSSALDFAYSVHTRIGHTCMGAKVNQKLVPISYKLKSGDQIEIITSTIQNPQQDWLDFVITAKARASIKAALRDVRKKEIENGKEIFHKKVEQLGIKNEQAFVSKYIAHHKVRSHNQFYQEIARGTIQNKQLREFSKESERGKWYKYLRRRWKKTRVSRETATPLSKIRSIIGKKPAQLIIGKDIDEITHNVAECCNPIPGDDVFGYMTEDQSIVIHRTNCDAAISLMSRYGDRIIKTKWLKGNNIAFLTGVKMSGVDEMGLVNKITTIISMEHHINMRSLNFVSSEGTFDGTLMLYVQDSEHLNKLIENLKSIKGIQTIIRIDRS